MINAHKNIVELCIKMAEEVYDMKASDNVWYRRYKASWADHGITSARKLRNMFVERWLDDNAMVAVQGVRQYLGTLCGDPNFPDDEKDKIVDVLAKDAALRGDHPELAPDNVWAPPISVH